MYLHHFFAYFLFGRCTYSCNLSSFPTSPTVVIDDTARVADARRNVSKPKWRSISLISSVIISLFKISKSIFSSDNKHLIFHFLLKNILAIKGFTNKLEIFFLFYWESRRDIFFDTPITVSIVHLAEKKI